MRARNIKPALFKNELLSTLPYETRLLFIGLWCLADREGRLEDGPLRIKMELFALDKIDVAPGLNQLQENGFILRYINNENAYIQIVNFAKHQAPHTNEKPSTIQAPLVKEKTSWVLKPNNLGPNTQALPSDSLIPDSLIPELNSTETNPPKAGGSVSPNISKHKQPKDPQPIATDKPKIQDSPSPPDKPKRAFTPIQIVVLGFKSYLGEKLDNPEWDKVYFKRYASSAKALLILFQNNTDRCLDCIDGVVTWLESKNLSWTPETIAKHAGTWKLNKLEQEAKR